MSIELGGDVLAAAKNFITVEYTTIDSEGQPITWPVTPYAEDGGDTIDVTTGLGYPKKADDAAANPKVALLFSDPTGASTTSPPGVLVQGDAEVDDRDLRANQDRYWEESKAKLPATEQMHPPKFMRGMLNWYYARIYIRVAPARALVWPECDWTKEPRTLGGAAAAPGRKVEESAVDAAAIWDERMAQLGDRYPTAAVSWAGADGYPVSARVGVTPDAAAKRIRLGEMPAGLEPGPGLACLTAHKHAPDFAWQENFQVRGVLTREGDAWVLVPRKLVGGFELPKESRLAALKRNFGKARKFRRIYQKRMAARS
jgi:pyridoxamine 5'-phosphate oxidase-like protein